MTDGSVSAGDPIAHAARIARIEAQDELLRAAESVLGWLDDRRAHTPPELLDGREGRHRKALGAAVGRLRGPVEERELQCPACGLAWWTDGHAGHGRWEPADEDDAYCSRCSVEGEA